MDSLIAQFSVYSIALPFLMFVIRIRRISADFHPFLLLITAGLINESIGTWLILNDRSNTLPFNAYVLAEALLVVWFFKKWELLQRPITLSFMALFISGWSGEMLLIDPSIAYCSKFILGSSFILTLLSISMVNKVLLFESHRPWKNPMFIISVCFVAYFSYTFLVECFFLNSNGSDQLFLIRIQEIFQVTNLITHLLYTLAIIWMPTRLRFTLPY